MTKDQHELSSVLPPSVSCSTSFEHAPVRRGGYHYCRILLGMDLDLEIETLTKRARHSLFKLHVFSKATIDEWMT